MAGWIGAAPSWAAGTPASIALGPWIFAAVALVLVAGLAYVAGSRRSRGSPEAAPVCPARPAAPVSTETAPSADQASTGRDDLAQRLMDIRPAGLRLWMRHQDGLWRTADGAPGSPRKGDDETPDDASVQEASGHATGQNHSRQGWVFRREDIGSTAWLLAWRGTADTAADDGPDAQDSASFSYTVSHDLRAPLRAVDGFTRILKEDYGRQLDRIGNDHLDRVLAAAARMNAMIDAMLSLARLSSQPLARQPVNLSQLAAYIAEDLQRGTPQRQVRLEIEPGLQVTGDPTLLRQVLENLLANAWKYTGRCDPAEIALRSRSVDGRRVFEVSDNGAGFDMRSADRLFGLFQRLHSANEFPGTGVGLASVKRIVHRHGGDIWAESEPGQGARFYFTLAG